METRSIASKSGYITSEASDDSFECTENVLAKIKRLRIEENYICQSMRKPIISNGVRLDGDFSDDSDYHKFKIHIKENFMSVKKLFDYVNGNISDHDVLNGVDVDDIKTAILELEDKIKSLKKYLNSEFVNLKRTEEELIRNINENPSKHNMIKNRHKIHSATYHHIVPSPVKEIVNSSFKCLEVQEFQEFLASSENRYGGWNEYYHNIFVKSWSKYIQVDCDVNLESYVTNVMNSDSFKLLIHELLQRLSGFTREQLILHAKWYVKYIYLKERQNIAIQEWRKKKLLIKNKTMKTKEKNILQKSTKYGYIYQGNNVAENAIDLSSSRDYKTEIYDDDLLNKALIDAKHHRKSLAYAKPTKQWISRCQTTSDHTEEFPKVAVNTQKLQIPKWRLGLQEF